MRKKVIVYSLLLLILIGLGAAFYGYKEFNRKQENIAELPSAYQLPAVQLIQEFTSNEQVSNTLYLGKIITVSGIVKSIDNPDGLATLSLGDSTSMSSVRCSLDSLYTYQATSVQLGSQIAIKGYCSGFNVDDLLGSDVILSRCTIEIINPQK